MLLYCGAAWSNICFVEEFVEMRFEIDCGICLIIGGGWLDSVLMYVASLLGLL